MVLKKKLKTGRKINWKPNRKHLCLFSLCFWTAFKFNLELFSKLPLLWIRNNKINYFLETSNNKYLFKHKPRLRRRVFQRICCCLCVNNKNIKEIQKQSAFTVIVKASFRVKQTYCYVFKILKLLLTALLTPMKSGRQLFSVGIFLSLYYRRTCEILQVDGLALWAFRKQIS